MVARNDLTPTLNKIEVAVSDLHLPKRAIRKLVSEHVAEVRGSIERLGFTVPILITSALEIVDGVTRVAAAKELGLDKIPAVIVDHLTPDEIRVLRLAANKLAENGRWDIAELKAEFIELGEKDFAPSLAGFDGLEVDFVLGHGDADDDEDEIPPLPETPICKPGDIWLCGSHRIMCGDSTNAEDVAKLLGTVKPHLMVTDPPYGVDYDPDWRNRADRANGKAYGARATGKVSNDSRADWGQAWALFPGDVAYVWHGALHALIVQQSLEATGFEIRAQIIWAKHRHVISRGHYHWAHEPCLYAVRKGGKGHWSGDRSQTTLWQVPHVKSESGHGTQKPVEVMRRPMLNNSSPGQAVYDPFLGSGTSLIAAETCQRVCLGMELSPAYCDVAVRRWQELTGETAVHAETGLPFDTMDDMKADDLAENMKIEVLSLNIDP